MTFNLEPFWEAEFATQIHALCAVLAFFIGCYIFVRRKGTSAHRNFGKVWVGLMAVVAISSFFIHGLRTWGLFSPLHLLSVFTLGSLAFALWCIKKGNISAHRQAMIGLFAGGLVFAGLLAFTNGLLMQKIFISKGFAEMLPRADELPGGTFGFVFGIVALIFFAVALLGRLQDDRKL